MPNAILRAVRAHAAAAPGRIALDGVDGLLEYAALAARVDRLAAWLQRQGVQRAALWGDNGVDWIVADLAAWQAGIVLVPLPGFFSVAQRQHVLDQARLAHLIVCGDRAGPADAVASRPSPLPAIRLDLLAPSREAPALPPGTCKISFTSGTTGQPKGVCLGGTMLEAVTQALASRIHAAAGMADALHAHFTLLPLSTLLENVAGVYLPLLLGKRVVVRPGAATGLRGSSQLELPRLLQALHQAQPQSLIVLPQILQALVAAAQHGLPPPASLRFVAVGGATTPAALIERARQHGIPAYEGYGLSECASVVALNAPGADRPGSVGRVLDHVQVRIQDGAIQVAGNVFPGYLGQPARRAGEWLDTGDLGHLDDAGFLHVTGRARNLIISSYGRNISPEWIEAELALCPSIAQAMVVGEAQPFLGAIVVPARGADAGALRREIAAANARLPDYARVRRFLRVDEPFTAADRALTENGRLRRDVIAARHAAGLAALFAPGPAAVTEARPAPPPPVPEEPVHDVL